MVTIRSSSSEVSSPALLNHVSLRGLIMLLLMVEIIPLVQVDIGLLANQVGITATDTLDLGQGVHNLLLSIDVGVQKTQDLRRDNVSLIMNHHHTLEKVPVDAEGEIAHRGACLAGWGRSVMTYELEVRLLS